MRQMRSIDVIFCCNVLIYFDTASKQQVVSYMYDSLNKGGYLFIGYSESLHGLSKAFKLVHLLKAMAYKKE
jgi:chemotaxis protein methyltransferase CheR